MSEEWKKASTSGRIELIESNLLARGEDDVDVRVGSDDSRNDEANSKAT